MCHNCKENTKRCNTKRKKPNETTTKKKSNQKHKFLIKQNISYQTNEKAKPSK